MKCPKCGFKMVLNDEEELRIIKIISTCLVGSLLLDKIKNDIEKEE